MAIRLIPYLLALALGVFIGISLSRKLFAEAPGSNEWEQKYRELYARYQELTRRLGAGDQALESKTNRMRQTLWDVQGILRNPEAVSPERARSALQEIETALEDSAD